MNNLKLIKLSPTDYVIVDMDKRAQEGYNFNFGLSQVDRLSRDYEADSHEWRVCFKITHSTQPLYDKPHYAAYKMLTVGQVEEAIYGYSVEKMAEESSVSKRFLSESPLHDKHHREGYLEGFKACQELLKYNRFTEVDMADLWMHVVNGAKEIMLGGNSNIGTFQEYIDKLSPKTEWDVTFDEQGKLKLI
jgi:hypothetical protein